MTQIRTKKRKKLKLSGKIGFDAKETIDYFLNGLSDWRSYYEINEANYHSDVSFLYDSQFSKAELKAYFIDHRPTLEVNLLHKIVMQIEGEFGDNVFSAKVLPLQTSLYRGAGKLQHAIELREALLRYIENVSTEQPRRDVFSNMIAGGYGVMRMAVETDPNNKFQQHIVHRALPDPTLAFFDPSARKPEMFKHDGMFCGVQTTISVDKLKHLYPDVDVSSIKSILPNHTTFSWAQEKDRWLIDGWRKEYNKNKYIARLLDGNIIEITSKEFADLELQEESNENEGFGDLQLRKPLSIVRKGGRRIFILEFKLDDSSFDIHFYRMSCNTILEHSIWPSRFFGLFEFPGQKRFVHNRERTIALAHYARDAQRFHNFIVNEIALRLKLSRYEPYLVTPAMIKGLQDQYRNVGQARSYLEYNLDTDSNQPIKPERQSPQELPQSLFVQQKVTEQQIQAVTGRFDANFGAPSNEASGVAILNRASQGNRTAQLYFDNFKMAYQFLMNATLDISKSILDNTRPFSITTGGNIKNFTLNKLYDRASDLSYGDFNVKISAGSSFELQKRQNLSFLTMLTQQYPMLIPYTIDLLLDNVALPNASQLVERVRQSPLINPYVILRESTDPKERQMAMQTLTQSDNQKQLQQQLLEAKMHLEQQMVHNDSTKAHADQMNAIGSAMSKLQDSQTKRIEAVQKGALESDKIRAEQARTEAEMQKANFELAKDVAKGIEGHSLSGLFSTEK